MKLVVPIVVMYVDLFLLQVAQMVVVHLMIMTGILVMVDQDLVNSLLINMIVMDHLQ